ncbi:MAG: bifunctional phosphoribosylaminoimidazolecarboxamide formyltransferase/IMP cyclohydrolase [Bacteroidetes bacterium]|nr:MAG: bifunctional phosphoribosylaminoimidazolecarboxamide formyltransferase/IMP cyclohydrolase [Bacteroidota bacterium]
MKNEKKIRNALISVYHKDKLEPIVRGLHQLGVKLFTTGGTQTFIEELQIPVIPVETLTDYPSILGGRVKTLHPKIFGGILSRRHNPSDILEMEEYNIPEIDLVVVDLYPFEATLASGAEKQEVIEKIDIGGISLIRAAAKNFDDVLIIPSLEQYSFLEEIIQNKSGVSTLQDRQTMAAHAFGISSHYDTQIFRYLNIEVGIPSFKESIQSAKVLRYGENPHQQATFFGNLDDCFTQLSGKELSYNNLLDIDSAINLMAEFTEPSFAILKHNNACGVASRTTGTEAWNAALEADPVSAFGGVLICNFEVDVALAKEVNKLFFEVLIAPAFSMDALEILSQKKNRILLQQKNFKSRPRQFRTLLNGLVEQDKDVYVESSSDLKNVTKRQASTLETEDLLFAMKLAKHTKSNTIVLARNKQLLASGTGQTSRVDALRQAIVKAKSFGFSLKGAVMASDAFFPFPDCVEIASNEGIEVVIQPGGSVKDQESIDYCDSHNMAMLTTGIRHFRH